MTISGDFWLRVVAATEALVFRCTTRDLANAFDLVRLAPPFEPADPDAAQYWRTVTSLARGPESSLERATELTHSERSTFAKALFFVLCTLAAETEQEVCVTTVA